jgi:ribosomal protein L37AE/L43A
VVPRAEGGVRRGKCKICCRRYTPRRGESAWTCDDCKKATDNIAFLHVQSCPTPHPELEKRLREFERRAAEKRPLFGEV